MYCPRPRDTTNAARVSIKTEIKERWSRAFPRSRSSSRPNLTLYLKDSGRSPRHHPNWSFFNDLQPGCGTEPGSILKAGNRVGDRPQKGAAEAAMEWP